MSKKKAPAASSSPPPAHKGPWHIRIFQRHKDDDPEQHAPGREYLDDCPVAARILAVVTAVADAPPPAFSGGGKWEAMHDEMAGFHEVRVDHKGRHYRLFCILERNGIDVGLDAPTLVIIDGMDKAFRTTFTDLDYARIRKLGDEYRRRKPRSVAS